MLEERKKLIKPSLYKYANETTELPEAPSPHTATPSCQDFHLVTGPEFMTSEVAVVAVVAEVITGGRVCS